MRSPSFPALRRTPSAPRTKRAQPLVALASLMSLALSPALPPRASAQPRTQVLALDRELRPDAARARASRARPAADAARAAAGQKRGTTREPDAQQITRRAAEREAASSASAAEGSAAGNDSAARARSERRRTRPIAPAHNPIRSHEDAARASSLSADAPTTAAASLPAIEAGTSLARVLHTNQLGLATNDGSTEEFVDRDGDGAADRRTTFDRAGGAFDTAVGAAGARYSVFTAYDNALGRYAGVLVTGFDTNGDFRRDASLTYDLRQTYNLRSAASVVAGTASDEAEFVVVSSVGRNDEDPNEPSAGVVLLVRDRLTNNFDPRRSRLLVPAGSGDLYNANSLALLPNGDLLIADFGFNELRVVRDTNGDRVPDTLDREAYYAYRYSDDAPLEVAANSRGVVFSHSAGADAPLLAIYDDDGDGYGDADEVAAEGLSIGDNLVLHGLTVDREGGVYVIEDAAGAEDSSSGGGGAGAARVIVFPDPALNGILRDATVYARADSDRLALAGLAFGGDRRLGVVRPLGITNSASRRGAATFGGLGTITGAGLTDGAAGATPEQARAAGLRVTMEGVEVPVLSFAADRINVYVPPSSTNAAEGVRAVVVRQNGAARAAADARFVRINPGVFTRDGTGAGEGIALLASGMKFTAAPFPAGTSDSPTIVALFGTGWRGAASVTARVGDRSAVVEFAGATSFPGLDQINVRLPANLRGALAVQITASDGATSRADVHLAVR